MSELAMKTLLLSLAVLIVVVAGYFFVLGRISQSAKPKEPARGRLDRCPNKPNCCCSEYADDPDHYVVPIPLADSQVGKALTTIRQTVLHQGGRLETEAENYLAFTFRSSLFGFVDDVEVRLDPDQCVLHIRSASRVGHSDLGVNKKRVAAVRSEFERAMSTGA